MPSAGTDLWISSVPMTLTIAVSVLLVLLRLGDLQSIATMLPASFVKWKECISLYNAVSLNRSKNNVARAMILPFVLFCTRHGLYPPVTHWTEELCGTASDRPFVATLITAGVFAAYLILRELCVLCFKGRSVEKSRMSCARNCVYTFFISAVILLLAASETCSLLSVSQAVTRNVALAVLAFVYGICILRKTQIFTYYSGYLAGILYLCTLEILPTGLLIVSGFLF